MDFESIERCWRDQGAPFPQQLQEGSVLDMLTNAEVQLRRDVRLRLRREAGVYVVIMGAVIAGFVGEFTPNRVLTTSGLLLLVGGLAATLWWAERRITQVPLDGSVRQALADLRSKLDKAGNAYLAAYITVFIITGLFVIGFISLRYGIGPQLVGTVMLSVLAVLWSVHSGRSYVDRMFRRYRAEVTDCLRQLEDEA